MKEAERRKNLRRAYKLVREMAILGYAMKNSDEFLNSYGALPSIMDLVNKLRKLPADFLAIEFFDLEIDAECDMAGGTFYADLVANLNRFLEFVNSKTAESLNFKFSLPKNAQEKFDSFVKEVEQQNK